MKYKVLLQRSDEGFAVSVPGLPGCWSQGGTEQEALENIADAIRIDFGMNQVAREGLIPRALCQLGRLYRLSATRRTGTILLPRRVTRPGARRAV